MAAQDKLKQDMGIPYRHKGKILLDCICKAFLKLLENEKECRKAMGTHGTFNPLTPKELENCFSLFDTAYKNQHEDPHLSLDRMSNVVWESWRKVFMQKFSENVIAFPSPLNVLYKILTVPEAPASSAYALVFCRQYLFEKTKLIPEHFHLGPDLRDHFQTFMASDIKKAISVFESSFDDDTHLLRVKSAKPAARKIQNMLCHFFAMNEIFYFQFHGENYQSSCEKAENYIKTFKNIAPLDSEEELDGHLRFAKFSYYDELPSVSSFINELSGIPMPITGADVVFKGGLQTASDSHLTVRLSGEPGTGKTSFALALGVALAPMGTKTFYFTTEEDTEDLKKKLDSLIPDYLEKLSIHENQNWFYPKNFIVECLLDKTDKSSNYYEYLNEIVEELIPANPKLSPAGNGFPAVCPLLIIIDSIRSGNENNIRHIDKLIKSCQKLNAVVILISSNDQNEKKLHHEIDYMVDMVLELKYTGIEEKNGHSERIICVSKTRYQLSEVGSHVFYISGKTGITIYPKLFALLDKKEEIDKPEPSESICLDFFNFIQGFVQPDMFESEYDENSIKALQIWEDSQILLFSYGSTGKAGLGMRLLLCPTKLAPLKYVNDAKRRYDMTKRQIRYDMTKRQKRILVVSMLYTKKYYEKLWKKITLNLNMEYIKNNENIPHMECLHFYSGNLASEMFVGKILHVLDTAILKGEPYTGILLDGIHNITLQFPQLLKNDMTITTLYNLLGKYRLTIVTTYTSFKINDKEREENGDVILQKHPFFLHTLMQSVDYDFRVQPATKHTQNRHYQKKYVVNLASCIRQQLHGSRFAWDRGKCQPEEFMPDKIEQSDWSKHLRGNK